MIIAIIILTIIIFTITTVIITILEKGAAFCSGTAGHSQQTFCKDRMVLFAMNVHVASQVVEGLGFRVRGLEFRGLGCRV